MKKLKIYKDIEEYFKDWFKSKIYNGNGVIKDSVFSDSERQDIIDMINDGIPFDEIIIKIKKWELN